MKNLGGKRPGAGRPKIPDNHKKVPITIRLPYPLVLWLRDQDGHSQADLIESALISHYHLSD